MPTTRRYRGYRRRAERLDDDVAEALLSGRGWIRDPSLDELRHGWRVCRDQVRAEWGRSHPGSRCFGEWLLDLIPEYGERRTTVFYSRIAPHRRNWELYGVLHVDLVPPVLESQAEYLDRHGLLTDDERRVLGEIVPAEAWFAAAYPALDAKIRQAIAAGRTLDDEGS
jgi:hypothetical protein